MECPKAKISDERIIAVLMFHFVPIRFNKKPRNIISSTIGAIKTPRISVCIGEFLEAASNSLVAKSGFNV